MNKLIKKIIILFIIFAICFPNISYCIEAVENNVINQNEENNNNVQNKAELSGLKTKKDEIEQQINENLSKINYVQGEMSNSVEQVLKLNDSIIEAEEEIKKIEKEIEEIQSKVDVVEKELEIIENDYNEKSKLLQKRMVALYEAGETTYLDVLLTSKGLVDFISNYYMIVELAESDSKIIEEIEKKLNTIEVKKSKLDAEKAEVKVKKAQMIKKTVALKNNRTLQNNYIIELSESEKNLQEQIKKFKEEEEEVERQIALAVQQAGLGLSYPGGIMAWPVGKEGTYITSAYGEREHPITGVVKEHTGIDIGNGGFGAPIIAAQDGIVTYSGWLGGYGNCIIIAHGDNISTLYGHGQKNLVAVGQEVKRGDVIMEMGSTGQSTGPHLHFEVREDNKPVNPITYLQ